MIEEIPAIWLAGPTAVGKSEVVERLAETLPLEVVSVDSVQVYRGMDIGSAKPDLALRARLPHHLIDLREPTDPYSAAEFVSDARRAIAAIRSRGRIPLLAGGTMLYFRALAGGLSPLPAADPALRTEITAEAAQHGWPAVHHRLAALDPLAAGRIHPHDAQRIGRALEVCLLTGRPFSSQRRAAPAAVLPAVRRFALLPAERGALHQAIAGRFAAMLAAGLIDEARSLLQRHELHSGLPAMRAVGYRQVFGYLHGRYDHAGMTARAVAATRQYAKRQMTWLRGEPGWVWYALPAKDAAANIMAVLKHADLPGRA